MGVGGERKKISVGCLVYLYGLVECGAMEKLVEFEGGWSGVLQVVC